MPDVADLNPGAARQTWRAALAVLAPLVLALVVLEPIAFLSTPASPTPADRLFDLALVAAGFATTRLMLRPGEGAVRRLIEAWAVAVRWGLPALIAVVIAVLAVSAVLLPPADLKAQGWTALWTLLGVSGAQLMRHGVFDAAASGELLSHLWVTGVAAQLFAGWTLVVAALIRLRQTRWIGALAALGVLLSLGLELWMRGRGLHPQAFYLAPANLWPFLIGAVWAAGPRQSGLVESSRLVRLGKLAWPFCLWLWPLAVMPRMFLVRSLTPWEWVAVVALSGLLAVATHRWIETPVRRRLGDRPRTTFAFAAACIGVVALVSTVLLATDGLSFRADARLLAEAAATRHRLPLQGVCNIEEGRLPPPMTACTTPPGGPAEVVVWGNSHAAQLTPAVLDWTARRGLRLRQVTRSGCLPVLTDAGDLTDADCLAFNRAAVRQMEQQPRPRLVVVGGAWAVLLARLPGEERARVRRLEADLEATVDRLRDTLGPQTGIVLLGDTPDFAFAPAACHARRRYLGLDTRRCDLAVPADPALSAEVERVLNRVAAGRAGVHVFDPALAVCEAGRCRTRGPQGPWYADNHHLTPQGGRVHTDGLAAVLDAAWARP